jgi:hypothetical protein
MHYVRVSASRVVESYEIPVLVNEC